MNRDVELLRGHLDQIQRSAQYLHDHALDLHVQAWERAGHGLEPPGRNPTGSAGPVGDPKAQTLWAAVSVEAEEISTTLQTLRVAVSRYFNQGPGVERSVGSMLSKGGLRAQLRYQKKRRSKPAEFYSPHNDYPQQNYPGGGREP